MLTRAMCIFHGASGLPTDRYVNTFYFFKGTAHNDADRIALAEALREFYDDSIVVGATPRAISDFLNVDGFRATDPLEIKMYTMADTTPRVPTHQSEHPINPNSVTPLPHEVAVCMSYKGIPTSGVPAGRRRGRIYLGPLNTAALQTSVSLGRARPTGNLTAAVPLLAQRFKTAVEVTGSDWVVHSPTGGLESSTVIEQVACDDAFDTQRRRGLAPTTAAYVALV